MCLFYLYANAKIEIHICSNKHETGLVFMSDLVGNSEDRFSHNKIPSLITLY